MRIFWRLKCVLIDVTINDFKYNNSDNIKLKGKGNKARLIPLENGMIKMLEKYIEHEKNSRVFFNPDDLLFLNKSGIRIQISTIYSFLY